MKGTAADIHNLNWEINPLQKSANFFSYYKEPMQKKIDGNSWMKVNLRKLVMMSNSRKKLMIRNHHKNKIASIANNLK